MQHLRELLQPVKLEPDLKQEIDENLDRIERNTRYTVDLAVALLRRFRQHPTKAHNVNELVNRAISLVEIPKNIKLVCHLDPKLPPVDISDLLVDAMIELISNALRVMETAGGVLRIASFKTGSRIAIQVTDSGPGIAAENLDQVFDLFFTTYPQGLGFGLWWVKTFLEQQHGQISVESRPNEGTTFTITLPGSPALSSG
ncbi:MAG: hypothetical protein HC875_40980 [Anaerolineales bacterium]|nr:hypothetical protein [Anaerolineales bacterium]